MKELIIRVLKSRTMNMFNEEWYNKTCDELFPEIGGKSGYVYFVSDGGKGNEIKIGSTKSMNDRLNSFNTVFPNGVYLKGYIYSDNYQELENHFHNKFSNKNIRREWFVLDANDFVIISEDYEYIKIDGFFNEKSKIYKLDYSNIKQQEIHGKYSGMFEVLNTLPKNIFITNSNIIESVKRTGAYEGWSDVKISRSIRKWVDMYNMDVEFHRNHKGRGIIIKDKL